MLKAIVFDFDGVIVDSEPLHFQAFAELFAPLGMSLTYEQYLDQYIGFDDRDAIRHACASIGRTVDPAQLAALIQQKAVLFESIVAQGVKAIPGAVELIESAAGAIELAICSGALRSDIELILPALRTGLGDRFSVIVSADDVERSKPDPACYRLACERLGLPPAHCLAIEDTPAGLEAARGAGMQTLGLTTTHRADQLDADRVVDSLAGLDVRLLKRWLD